MNRLSRIKCLVKGHNWGAWLPNYEMRMNRHWRECRRCGTVQLHPEPLLLERALGWVSHCPRCGRKGFVRGVMSRPDGTVLPVLWWCLECMIDGCEADLFDGRVWWTRDRHGHKAFPPVMVGGGGE